MDGKQTIYLLSKNDRQITSIYIDDVDKIIEEYDKRLITRNLEEQSSNSWKE